MLSSICTKAGLSFSKAHSIAKPKTITANFMKFVQSIIIWTILVFVTLTLLTMKNEAASDGIDTYGFPFTFFDHFGGKCDDCYHKFGFKITHLFIDILFALTSSFFITILKRKLTNKPKSIKFKE